uniref:Uncharacterized protein n=1 Tax=Rhizophora mucronata TaxID=61149 RepID=A0A2P2NYQ4_RHIMU
MPLEQSVNYPSKDHFITVSIPKTMKNPALVLIVKLIPQHLYNGKAGF